jgi:hypothetical protein
MAVNVQPSRKPGFWAEVDKLNRAESKAAKKAAEPVVVKSAPKKTAKQPRAKGGKTRR